MTARGEGVGGPGESSEELRKYKSVVDRWPQGEMEHDKGDVVSSNVMAVCRARGKTEQSGIIS